MTRTLMARLLVDLGGRLGAKNQDFGGLCEGHDLSGHWLALVDGLLARPVVDLGGRPVCQNIDGRPADQN